MPNATPKTPVEWARVLDPNEAWQHAYPFVCEAVREHLKTLAPDASLSTAEVVETFMPEGDLRGVAQINARQRFFRALSALAVHDLADCAHRGAAIKNRFGSEVRPWRWHAPGEATNAEMVTPERRKCPHCGAWL